jgi:hypothetical protein
MRSGPALLARAYRPNDQREVAVGNFSFFAHSDHENVFHDAVHVMLNNHAVTRNLLVRPHAT